MVAILKIFKRFVTNRTWDLNEACVLIVFCHFPMWYPWSGVVPDCSDS